jgi:hypothetical protein
MERRHLLDESPGAIGADWARAVCQRINQEGRTIAGGWPGTIVEARARIAGHLRAALARHRMEALAPEELALAANATYARAKQEWLAAERRSRIEAKLAARKPGASPTPR